MARSLIEQWFPAAAVGAESLRERGAASALPPISFLHVWWARRPLVASRAAVLASLLPAWPRSEDHSEQDVAILNALKSEFPSGEAEYHAWFLEAVGILGDPVAARIAIASARGTNIKLANGGYGYSRAFTRSPSDDVIERLQRLAHARAAFSGLCLLYTSPSPRD